MIDLSYTNKDGLNLYEGFDNGFDYHRDGKQDGDGYANGGYPEVTGETSEYTDISYKTGDNPDFWGNGNTFDIITEGGEEEPALYDAVTAAFTRDEKDTFFFLTERDEEDNLYNYKVILDGTEYDNLETQVEFDGPYAQYYLQTDEFKILYHSAPGVGCSLSITGESDGEKEHSVKIYRITE